MKCSFSIRWLVLVLLAGITPNSTPAQTAAIAGQPTQNVIGYQIGGRDADQRVWQEIVQVTDSKGNTSFQTNQAYVELASGLNYWDSNSKQWLESKEEIDAYPGGAIAQYGPQKVIFAGDLNSAVAIDMQTPDGQRLQSRVIGLGYFDVASGKSVLIAEVTDSTGQILPPNQVIYTNAFTGVRADVCYTYTKAGFEQDVILRQRPPAPEVLGLSSASTRLQVLTEFVSAPPPVIEAVPLPASAGGLTDDRMLDFGAMKMRPGKAFAVGATQDDLAGVPVRKQWATIDGRTILIEDVALSTIAGRLAALTVPGDRRMLYAGKNSMLQVVSTKPLLPAPKAGKAAKRAMKIASRKVSAPGVVLDYTTLNGTYTDKIFQADTTYYVSGPVYSYGTNTFEGGAVLKYATNGTIQIMAGYPGHPPGINWKGGAYRPVIFTAKDDNTIGDTIPGSSGNPAGYYGNPMLLCSGVYLPAATLSGLRFCYAGMGIQLAAATVGIYDVQFVKCGNGFALVDGSLLLGNALFTNTKTNFVFQGGFTVNAQNVTFAGSTFLAVCPASHSGCSLFLTNCILENVVYFFSGAFDSATGDYNGFYANNSSPFGTSQFTSPIYPFQTVGAGNYYLANGCGFFNQGTTSIDPAILADLARKTTYPPTVLTGGFTTDYTVTPTSPTITPVLRDNTGTPDLGYHYDPLDYCGSALWCGVYGYSGTLYLTNGVAIGFYGSSGFTGNLSSQGTALQHNQLTRYSTVQEQPKVWGATNSGSLLGGGNVSLWLTDVSFPADGAASRHLFDSSANSVAMQDCQLQSVYIPLVHLSTSGVSLTNNVFKRSTVSITEGNTYPVALYNNLFLQGTVQFWMNDPYSPYAWNISDNLFVQSSDSFGNGAPSYPVISNNGYYQAATLGHGESNPQFVASLDFLAGPLGDYYYPASGANLARLIDAGSRSASAAGLSNYTIQTNSSPDTGTVDIGFHYATFIDLTTQCRSDRIVLFWNVPDWINQEQVGFKIYRADSPGGPYALISSLPDTNQRMFVDNNIVIGATYYYKITFLYLDPATGSILEESPFSNMAAGSTCDVPYGGPTDVAFIIDNTWTMRFAYPTIHQAIDRVANDIAASSGNDYRLALVTPDLDNDGWDENEHDMVDVRVAFTNSISTFTNAVNTLFAWGGLYIPESTDECLNTVVNGLLADGRMNPDSCTPVSPILQTNDFRPKFRSNARKLVVIFTDAPPGGFCDPANDPYDSSYEANAHQYALQATTNHIRINAILFKGGYFENDARTVLQDYGTTTCGWYSEVPSTSEGDNGYDEAIDNMLYTPGQGNCP